MTKYHAPIAFGHVALQNPHLHSPESVIASVVVPASAVGLPADTAIWQCDPKDLPNLYFLVASNGTGKNNELYPLDGIGIKHVYPTLFNRIGIQLSMNGVDIRHKWTKIPLPLIAPDKDGRVYIRLQHIPPLHAQLYSVWGMESQGNANCARIKHSNWNRNYYDCDEPHAYIQLAGVPGLTYDTEGSDSNLATNQRARSSGNGFGYRLFNAMMLSRTPSCVVRSQTSQVTFPSVSVHDLEAGKSVSERISIQLECDPMASSGRRDGQTAISLQASPGAYAAVQRRKMVATPGGGAWYLVSDLYGHDQTLAKGVGISLYSGKQRRYFSNPTDPGDLLTADSGWHPFADGATCNDNKSAIPGHDGYQLCQLDWTVYLEKLPGHAVTPGKVHAVARVSIKVP